MSKTVSFSSDAAATYVCGKLLGRDSLEHVSDSDIKEGVLLGVDGGVSFTDQVDSSDIDEVAVGMAEYNESRDSLTIRSSVDVDRTSLEVAGAG